MFIYVVAGPDDAQPWKVGRTTDPDKRLISLQAHSPVALHYVKIVEAHPTLEGSIHRQFAQFRTHGEWFDIPEDHRQTLLARLDGEPWVYTVVTSLKRKKGRKHYASRRLG